MKNNKLFLLMTILFTLLSCEKDEDSFFEKENLKSEENIGKGINETILEQDTNLPMTGSVFGVWFKGGTTICFDDEGKVISGTLLNNSYLRPSGSSNSIFFKGGTKIIFDVGLEGRVKEGILLDNNRLRIAGRQTNSLQVWFKGDNRVIFVTGQEGKIQTGTLLYRVILASEGTNGGAFFEADTEVTFNDFGQVIL